MLVWIIDINKASNLFTIYFNDVAVQAFDSNYYASSGYYAYLSNYCGLSSIGDYPAGIIGGDVPHSASYLTVKVVSHYTSSDKFSFGFRNVSILFRSPNPPNSEVCDFVGLGSSTSSCLCPVQTYNAAGSSSCTACATGCKSCMGPALKDCTSCLPGYSFDGSQCFKCDASCSQCSGTAANQCIQCPPGKYLFYDNTCISSCSSPLVPTTTGSFSTCALPCGTSGFYLSNGTCATSCPSPFTSVTTNGVQYCNFPCSGSNFYYPDGSCQTSCSSPFTQVIKGVESYCQSPCASNEVYFSNSTCGSSCPSPFTSTTTNGVQYCNFPCTYWFWNWNSNCQPSCNSPLVKVLKGVERYCELPCPSGQWYYENATCASSCDYPFTQVTGADGVSYCNFMCSGTTSLDSSGNCQSSCSSPYTLVTKGVERYCELLCVDPSFLYQNNSCGSSCSAPFVQLPVPAVSVTYCNFPCDSTSSTPYLNWNTECQASCNSPLVIITQGTETYCELPCGSASYYLYQNDTCKLDCPHPFTQNSDYNGDLKYCDFPCTGTSFLYWDDTCRSDCDHTWTQKIDGYERYCIFPCDSSSFFYPNHTCQSTCPTPYTKFINGSERYCNAPCSGTDYYYWDTTCQSSCPTSFQYDQNGVSSCSFHCSQTEFLYWNQTCQTACESPLKTIIDAEGYQTCSLPCSSGDYLYPNGSCISSCDYQITQDNNGVNYCTFPCAQYEYLYPNVTCSNTCNSPYLPETSPDSFLLCESPCADDEYYRLETELCVSHCSAPLVVRQDGVLQICMNVPTNPSTNNTNNDTDSNPSIGDQLLQLGESATELANKAAAASAYLRPTDMNSVFMLSLSKTLKYIQYVNVTLPEAIRDNFKQNSNSSQFSLTSFMTYKMPQKLKENFSSGTVPTAFASTVLHTSYLVNQWEALSSFFILILVAIIFLILSRVVKKTENKFLVALFQRFKTITRWNFVLFLFFNSFDNMTFFLILELRNLQLDTFYGIVSLVSAIAVTLAAIFILIKTFLICREHMKLRTKVFDINSKEFDDFHEKNEPYQVLYAGFQDTSFMKQAYLFFVTLKIILCYIIVACLYSHPLIQAILLTILSLLMIAYVAKERPTHDRFHLVVILFFEIIGLLVNACLMVIAVLDNRNEGDTPMRNRVTGVVVISLTTVDLASSLFMWVYLCIGVHSAYKMSRKEGVENKTAWLNVIVIPYRSPGMDFCDETMDESYDLEEGPKMNVKPNKRRRIRVPRRRPRKVHPTSFGTGITAFSENTLVIQSSTKSTKELIPTETQDFKSNLRQLFKVNVVQLESELKSFDGGYSEPESQEITSALQFPVKALSITSTNNTGTSPSPSPMKKDLAKQFNFGSPTVGSPVQRSRNLLRNSKPSSKQSNQTNDVPTIITEEPLSAIRKETPYATKRKAGLDFEEDHGILPYLPEPLQQEYKPRAIPRPLGTREEGTRSREDLFERFFSSPKSTSLYPTSQNMILTETPPGSVRSFLRSYRDQNQSQSGSGGSASSHRLRMTTHNKHQISSSQAEDDEVMSSGLDTFVRNDERRVSSGLLNVKRSHGR